MTVSTTTNRVIYRGNGAATSFAVNFKVIDEDHLVVRRRVFATGVFEHTYVGTDYSYSGLGASSGTLTLNGTALDDDYELVIERIVPYTQELDIVNSGGFYPETVEEQLDFMVMGLQQLDDLTERAFIVPEGESGLIMPREADRIGPDGTGTLAGWDEEGNLIAVELIASSEQGMLTEAQRRISRDAILAGDIAEERDARIAADDLLDTAIDALDTRVDSLETTVTSGRLAYPTWAALNAVTGTAGQVAEVPLTDAGTHTDPVVGGTVNNSGIFRWSASPAGWERLYDVDAASAQGYAADAEASADAAAASEAILAANGVAGVEHDEDETVARPAAGIVLWSGEVDPDNRQDGDVVIIRSGLAPVRDHKPPPMEDVALDLWAGAIRPTIHAPNGVVMDWLDLSGTGNHLSRLLEARKPAYVASHADFNDRPVVSFDGVDDNMVCPVFTATVPQPLTVIAIAKNESVVASEQRLFDASGGGEPRVLLATNRAGFVTGWAGSGFVVTTTAAGTDLRLYIVTLDANTMTIYVNGPQVGTGTAGTGTLKTIRIAEDATATNRFFGQVAWLRLIGRVVSADERTAAANFFAGHYGGIVS